MDADTYSPRLDGEMKHTLADYRKMIENKESVLRREHSNLTWGDIWDVQESVIEKAMLDMREECAKAADPVDESLSAVIRQIKVVKELEK